MKSRAYFDELNLETVQVIIEQRQIIFDASFFDYPVSYNDPKGQMKVMLVFHSCDCTYQLSLLICTYQGIYSISSLLNMDTNLIRFRVFKCCIVILD